MAKTEVVLYFLIPRSDSRADIEVKGARLVSTAPISSLVEAIQAKFGRQLPDIASGKRIKVFVEVDPSSSLSEYGIRDGDALILWVERPEELVEPL